MVCGFTQLPLVTVGPGIRRARTVTMDGPGPDQPNPRKAGTEVRPPKLVGGQVVSILSAWPPDRSGRSPYSYGIPMRRGTRRARTGRIICTATGTPPPGGNEAVGLPRGADACARHRAWHPRAAEAPQREQAPPPGAPRPTNADFPLPQEEHNPLNRSREQQIAPTRYGGGVPDRPVGAEALELGRQPEHPRRQVTTAFEVQGIPGVDLH
jgi:hypothetical protein